ncbi:hypothetical protein [Cystobacter fuscus]|uniref:hypothetical protein n=1 Tax=Cystobacter fuscus TaxID=43 RepID=UPI0037C06072
MFQSQPAEPKCPCHPYLRGQAGSAALLLGDNHTSQLVSDEFNDLLVTFMQKSDARRA